MLHNLPYLADEICSGLEVFYSGRTGGQSVKTSFILCDDYTELMAKLALLVRDPDWSDKNNNGHFKAYPVVMNDLVAEFGAWLDADVAGEASEIVERMKTRRGRRNGFFHSAHLLDMNVTERMCLEAYCDLITLGRVMFEEKWEEAEAGAGSLETWEALLRLDHRCLSEPQLAEVRRELISEWSRNTKTTRSKGVQEAAHPNDLHLRLCVQNGGTALRDRLRDAVT